MHSAMAVREPLKNITNTAASVVCGSGDLTAVEDNHYDRASLLGLPLELLDMVFGFLARCKSVRLVPSASTHHRGQRGLFALPEVSRRCCRVFQPKVAAFVASRAVTIRLPTDSCDHETVQRALKSVGGMPFYTQLRRSIVIDLRSVELEPAELARLCRDSSQGKPAYRSRANRKEMSKSELERHVLARHTRARWNEIDRALHQAIRRTFRKSPVTVKFRCNDKHPDINGTQAVAILCFSRSMPILARRQRGVWESKLDDYFGRCT